MAQSLRVLIINDSDAATSRLLFELRRGGFAPIAQRVNSAEAMSFALARQSWDLIVADTSLPQCPMTAITELLKQSGMDIPFMPMLSESAAKNGATSLSSHANGTSKDVPIKLPPALKRRLVTRGQRTRDRNTKGMLRYLAEYDPLTSLPNRNLFQEQLRKALRAAQRNKKPFALVVLGLDRFREINHTLGPQNGDWILREVAQRFQKVARRGVTTARLGGDEFGALFRGATKERAEDFCGDVLTMFDAPFLVQDLPIDVSACLGVAIHPDHGNDANLLLQRANIALDQAKQFGGGFSTYESSTDPYNQQKLVNLGGLRKAIEESELVLHFQPKVNFTTKRTEGVEALVRWNHPKIGMVPPWQFVPVAERTGLIHALSRWVLRAALDQCQAWIQSGLHIPVAVNLSPRNFHDHQLLKYIGQLLEERGLAPKYLELEITESVIMSDAVHVLQALNRLSQMGVRAFIDDFGTGYSSLGHLKKLPVAGIKIDKSFVIQMTNDDNDSVIVRSTIELGHNLGLKVIAEGVESPEIWERLANHGCDAAQGYYMSRPKPPEELDRWFAESPWGIKKSSQKDRLNK